MQIEQRTVIGLQDKVYAVAKNLMGLGYSVQLTINNTLVCGKVLSDENPEMPLVWLSPIDGEQPKKIDEFIKQMNNLLELHHEAN